MNRPVTLEIPLPSFKKTLRRVGCERNRVCITAHPGLEIPASSPHDTIISPAWHFFSLAATASWTSTRMNLQPLGGVNMPRRRSLGVRPRPRFCPESLPVDTRAEHPDRATSGGQAPSCPARGQQLLNDESRWVTKGHSRISEKEHKFALSQAGYRSIQPPDPPGPSSRWMQQLPGPGMTNLVCQMTYNKKTNNK